MSVPVFAAAEYVLRHAVDKATCLAEVGAPHDHLVAVLSTALAEAELLQADAETLGVDG